MNMAARMLSSAAGVDVIYHRGQGGTQGGAAFRATRGQTQFQSDDGNIVRLEHTDADFIFPKENILTLMPPQKGDTIRLADTGEVFEVLAPDGKRCYRNCDPSGVLIRVHTKQVGQ